MTELVPIWDGATWRQEQPTVSVDAPPSSRERGRTSAEANRINAAKRREMSRRSVLRALLDGPKTLAQILDVTGLTRQTVGQILWRQSRANRQRVVREELPAVGRGRPRAVWSLQRSRL